MTRHTTTTRLFASTLAAALSLTALSGCSAGTEADIVKNATMSWQGAEPSSPLEDDDAVKFMRDYYYAQAVAWNSGDFTLDLLTSVTSEAAVEGLATTYAKQGDEPVVFNGPRAFAPLKVKDGEDGGVVVTLCEADRPVYLNETKPKSGGAMVSSYELSSTGSGGYEVGSIENGSAHSGVCDGVDIPVALFDTPPTMPETPVTEVVRGPEID
jgi:hypothetical protein